MSCILYLLWAAKLIFALDALNKYAGKYTVPISNEESSPFGTFGASEGPPLLIINAPSLSNKILSILYS